MNASETEGCTFVEMQQKYPFGELKEAAEAASSVLVRKKLVYDNKGQLQIIKKMVHFLSSLESEYLIHLEGNELCSGDTFFFLYEYVPLTLQKWILDLGDDIIEEIEFEMLSLANYLTQKSIKFHFDSANLGLSKDIKVKYFLNEFSIDDENKMKNYKEVQEQIRHFFLEFRKRQPKQEEEYIDFTDRKSADSALLLNRLEMLMAQSKRESWDGKSASSLASVKSKKNLMISEKIQNSKKKQMEILERLKKLKEKTHE